MAFVIKDRKITPDPWQWLEPDAGGAVPSPLPAGRLIVPLAVWRIRREALLARGDRAGVWLASGDDPAVIAPDLDCFGVVAVHFPKFTDGRGYSTGRLLRERHGWRGELRAAGDVFRDVLHPLARCGFNAFVLRAGESLEEALGAFDEFSDCYQGAVEPPLPLYRRRDR